MSTLSTSHQQDGSSDFEVAVALILDLLFFANSRPLHRQVLSWCRSLPAHKFAAVPPLLVAQVHKAVAASKCRGPEMQPIPFAEPMLSLLEFKPVQLPLRQVQLNLYSLSTCIHVHALADAIRQQDLPIFSGQTDASFCMQLMFCMHTQAQVASLLIQCCWALQ